MLAPLALQKVLTITVISLQENPEENKENINAISCNAQT